MTRLASTLSAGAAAGAGAVAEAGAVAGALFAAARVFGGMPEHAAANVVVKTIAIAVTSNPMRWCH